MTRIAIISDTHLPRGGRRLPGECLRELEAADLILHAGDFTTFAVLEDLRALAPVEGVHGNMDAYELQTALPRKKVVDVDGLRIGMIHDPGPRAVREERLIQEFPGCAAVVYGHTHQPALSEHRGVVLVNPGSPTERRRSPTRAICIAEVAEGRFQPWLQELP